MILSKHSEDKELFSETLVEGNTVMNRNFSIDSSIKLIIISIYSKIKYKISYH